MTDSISLLNTALSGRYTVEREIGEGGMANVYLARDERHERDVAIKVLKPELAALIGADRFLTEIKTTANLQHPHILPLFDSGEANDFVFYVMPYVEGDTLRERIDRERHFGVDETTSIMTKVASALDYAHDRGVVHRDIKPSNVLMSQQGEPLVADFGIALALDAVGDARITQTGFMVGTPAYCSPEQAAAEPTIDGRSDLYSLACVAFEMLAGEPPYTGPSALAITSKRLTTPIPSVRTVRDALPPDMDAALKRALATIPQDRFDTVGAFAEALGSREARSTPPARRSRSRLGVVVGIAAVAAVAGAGWLLTRPTPSSSRARVVIAPFENLTGEPAFDGAGQAASEWLSQSLAQASIAEAILPVGALRDPTGSGYLTPGASAANVAEAARMEGFGTVITGSYYLAGDSLEFQARVTNAEDGSLVTGVGPVRGPVDEPLETAAALADQLFGSLGAYLDPLLLPDSWAGAVRPPNYRAWQAHVRGREFILTDAYPEAAEAALEALSIDPTFGRAYFLASGALPQLNGWPIVDSLLAVWAANLGQMLPVDRSNLAMIRNELRGDLAEAVTNALESARLAPNSGPHLHALWLTGVAGQPSATAELYAARDPEHPFWRSSRAAPAWAADAHHLLGSYDTELALSREGLASYPGYLALKFGEIRALVGLGRFEEAAQGVEALPTLVAHRGYLPTPWWTPGRAMMHLAMEMKSHGAPDGGRPVAESALEWYRSRPAAGREDTEYRAGLAEALLLVGDVDAARVEIEDLIAVYPTALAYHGLLGVAAARAGDTDEADRIDRFLANQNPPFSHGEPSYWRARIADVSGDVEQVTGLLQTASAEGSYRRQHWHYEFNPELISRLGFDGGR